MTVESDEFNQFVFISTTDLFPHLLIVCLYINRLECHEGNQDNKHHHLTITVTMFLFWIVEVQHIVFLHLLHDSSPLLLLLHLPSPSLAPPPPRLDWLVIIPRQYPSKLPPIDDDVGGGGGGGGGASLLTLSDFLLLVLSDVPKLLLFLPVTESGAG